MSRGNVRQIIMLAMIIFMMAAISRFVDMTHNPQSRTLQAELEDELRLALYVGQSEIITPFGNFTRAPNGIQYYIRINAEEAFLTDPSWLLVLYYNGYWRLAPLTDDIPEDFVPEGERHLLEGPGQWGDVILFRTMPFDELEPGRYMLVRRFERAEYPHSSEYLFIEFFVE